MYRLRSERLSRQRLTKESKEPPFRRGLAAKLHKLEWHESEVIGTLQ